MYAIYNPAVMEKVVATIREELERIVQDGVTADELARAKSGYIQEQQVHRTSDSALASNLADTLYADRTMEYYANVEQAVNALSPDEVLAALQKYIHPKLLAVVVAGDFKAAEKAEAKPAEKK